jgi:dolichol kinase
MMLAVILCIAGLFALLVLTEYLASKKILRGEYLRKFLHITAGSFIASWPWLISWRSIQILAVLMLGVVLAGRYLKILRYHGRTRRVTYGDIFLALAVLVSSFIAGHKVFFALAILEVALADGLAAVVGLSYGKEWGYKVFGYTKTVVGTMVFWIVSIGILTVGLLAAHDLFTFTDYYYLLLLLPPVLTLLENLAVLGIDNLIVPLVTIAALRLFHG